MTRTGTDADDISRDTDIGGEPTDRPPVSRTALYAVVGLMLAALLAFGAAVVVLANRHTSQAIPLPTTVDVGFARDMTTHHLQAIQMAGIARDRTEDPAVKELAFDVETSQQEQVGEMTGWLGIWGLSLNNPDPPMVWMGSMAAEHPLQPDGRMPGMAGPAEVNQLKTLPPAQMDVLFLQLLIRHHQGGLPMLDYAQLHAATPTVANLAHKAAAAQTLEIGNMKQMLTARGAAPLPTG